MKGLKTKREIKEHIDDNTKFFTQCKDIVKDETGYHFEESAWIDNGYLCSYHSIEELFNPEEEYNRNCATCSHSSLSGYGLLGDKYGCELASEIHRKNQSTIDFCKENNINPEHLYISTNSIVRCDAYNEINELTFIRNMKELVDFMYKTFNMLGGWDGICPYYGFEIPYDWDNNAAKCDIYEYYKNGGKFEYVPEENEFPVVIYFDYDTDSPYRNHLKWISLKGENYGRMD